LQCSKTRFLLIFLAHFYRNFFSDRAAFSEKPGNGFHTPYREFFNRVVAATLEHLKSLWGITDMEFSNLFGKTAYPRTSITFDERGMHCSSFGGEFKDLMKKQLR